MRFGQIIGPLAAILLACLSLYLLIAHRLLSEPPAATPSLPRTPAVASPAAIATKAATADRAALPERADSFAPAAGRKRIEIFGRVLDREGRALPSVVIAEERYHHSTRSDSEGRYRLLLEIPRHRYPVLHFLRSGYAPARFRLGRGELDATPVYRLDATLDDALDAVAVEGRVGNELGIGLEGARVQLTASYPRNSESFYLTEFTDSRGNFRFEAVRAGQHYRLSVNLTPQYPYYEDEDFFVAQNPEPASILLHTLEFVDVEGMLLNRDGLPVTGYQIYIANRDTGIHTRKIVSDSSGYFRLDDFPLGRVEIATRGAEFHRITGLELRRDNYQNLHLIVDRGDRYLSGWVSDASGMALDTAMVTVNRKFDDDGLQHTSYRSQGTDLHGGFAFADLGAGEHQVTAYAQGYEKQELSLNFDSRARVLHFRLETSH